MDEHDYSRLDVFFIVNRLFEWSQNFVTRELVEMNRLGVGVTIAARDVLDRKDLTDEELGLKRRFVRIRENPFSATYLLRHLALPFRRPRAYFSAWRALLTMKHRPSRYGRAVVCLFRAAGLVPIVEARSINLIHAYFLTAAGETALYLSKLTGIPFGATAYAMDIYVDNSGLAAKLRHAAYVNGTTKYNERVLAELVPQRRDRMVTKYYGIHVPPQLANPIPHDGFTFIAAGRLVQKKGFRYLIDACGLLREEGLVFECRIVGAGPLGEELESLVAQRELNGLVVMSGYVPPNKMQDVYRSGDVFVAPCVVADNGDVDGLPNVCLEAMSNGLPVISTTVSGIPECIEEGRNGWLVPPNDAGALSAAMRTALESPNLGAMRVASHRTVLERFDVRKNARPIADLLLQYYRH